MKRFLAAVKRFFSPAADSSTLVKAAPYITVAFLMIVLYVFSTVAWEYTNQTKFCGLTCHTMPPEYRTQQVSAHANVSCEDCHLGRDSLAVMFPRKVEYSWATGTAMITGRYEYPIVAKSMRPARDACENCHNPAKFSSDKLFELKRYADDKANTLTTVFMLLKTGGGTQRQGLGYGIHWHVENPVYFYATDKERQNIPYVLVTRPDGSSKEYVDVESKFDPATIKKDQLQVMDCITCHNRTAHDIPTPDNIMNNLIGRGTVSQTIPEIHKKGVEMLTAKYATEQEAHDAIAKLDAYYKQNYADFYAKNSAQMINAIMAIQEAYTVSVFPEQKIDWTTHPNNMEHKNSAGCFRCHDGKHISPDKKDTVRLECNLCHSIPTVSTSFQLVSNIPVAKGFEPDTHKSPNWINLHRTAFDKTCVSCHTVDDPGGVSNKSFCSNSVCHGANWKFAGFNAPKLREMLPTPVPQPTATVAPTKAPTTAPAAQPTASGGAAQPTAAPAAGGGAVTFASLTPTFEAKCGACHGAAGIKGVFMLDYAKLMAGGAAGPIIVAGKPDDSLLVKVQSGSHPGQLSADELAQVKKWISAGAPEK